VLSYLPLPFYFETYCPGKTVESKNLKSLSSFLIVPLDLVMSENSIFEQSYDSKIKQFKFFRRSLLKLG
jgi:hypothetical protein